MMTHDLRRIAPTLCHVLDADMLEGCRLPPLKELSTKVDRCLIFAADALGMISHQQFPEKFSPLYRRASVTIDLDAMSPSVTPVCFGSMFTGLLPEEHGITTYRKPVLEVETVFDTLIRAGKRVAIVAVKGSSIATIFGNRSLDYHLEDDDRDVLEQASQLILLNEHDFIVAYQQEFDDIMHRTTPVSPEAQQAIDHHVGDYLQIAELAKSCWTGTWMTAFVTDHGTHVDPETGLGSHGLNIPQDLETRHFFTLGQQGTQ